MASQMHSPQGINYLRVFDLTCVEGKIMIFWHCWCSNNVNNGISIRNQTFPKNERNGVKR